MPNSICLAASSRFLKSILENPRSNVTEDKSQWEWWRSQRESGTTAAADAARDRLTNCFTDCEDSIMMMPVDLCSVAKTYLEQATELLSATDHKSGVHQIQTLGNFPTQGRSLGLETPEKKAWIHGMSQSIRNNSTSKWRSALKKHLHMLGQDDIRDAMAADAIEVLAETAYHLADSEKGERAGVLESLLTVGLASMIAAKALGVPDDDMRAAHAALQSVRERSQAVDTWLRTAGLLENHHPRAGLVARGVAALQRVKSAKDGHSATGA